MKILADNLYCWAGVLYDTGRTKQGYNKTVGTNYIGHFLLTHLLSELMKKSAPSRIINVSSSVFGRIGKLDLSYCTTTPSESLRPVQLYSLSKLYLILHAKELGRRLKGILPPANVVQRLYFHRCLSAQLWGWRCTLSPSHNTSTGPMSFLGVSQ